MGNKFCDKDELLRVLECHGEHLRRQSQEDKGAAATGILEMRIISCFEELISYPDRHYSNGTVIYLKRIKGEISNIEDAIGTP